MKLAVFNDKEDFHAWQHRNSRGVDSQCQQSISVMAFPIEYPCVMVWSIHEVCDIDSPHPYEPMDILHYKYVYLSDFPVKKIKKGVYLYQIFQTSDYYE